MRNAVKWIQSRLPVFRIGLAVMIAFFVLIITTFFVVRWVQITERQKLEFAIQNEIELYSALISQQANLQFAQLNGLQGFVLTQLTHRETISPQGFELFAENIQENFKTIRNLSIAPQGVQTFVYPLIGNEVVLGQNLLLDERQHVREDIQQAMQTKTITVSDPYRLRDGSLGFAARQAIFVEDEFWGLVTLVVEIPPIIEGTRIYQNSNFGFALIDSEGDFFYGDETILQQSPVYVPVHLPQGEWQIAAIPVDGWQNTVLNHTRSTRLLVSILAVLLTLFTSSVSASVFRLNKDFQSTKLNLDEHTHTLTTIQEELERKEKKILQLTENAMDCIYRITFLPKRMVDYINPIVEEMTGYAPHDFYDHPALFDQIHLTEDHQKIENLFETSPRFQKQSTREFLWLKKNGQTVWVEEKNSYRYDEAGQLVSVEGIVRDISSIKAMQFAIRESENKFRQLAESIREVFWLRERETGNMVYVSPTYQDVWGRTPASLYQDPKSFIESIHPDDLARIGQAQRDLQETNHPFDEEYRIVRPDGEIRWVWARAFPVYDEMKTVIRYAGIAEDITEIKFHRDQQEMTGHLSACLRSITQTDEMITVILEKVNQFFAAPTAAFVLIDHNFDHYIVYKSSGQYQSLEGTHLPTSHGLVAQAIQHLKTVWTNDIFTNPHAIAAYHPLYHKAEVVLPLISEQEALGAIVINREESVTHWDLNNMEAVTNIAANALRRAFIYEELKRSIEQLSVLHQIDTVITNEMQLETVVQKMFQAAQREFLVDTVRLYQYDQKTHYSRLLADSSHPNPPQEPLPTTQILGEAAVFKKEIYTIPDLKKYQGSNKEIWKHLREAQVHWYQIVPLVSQSNTIGFLEFQHHTPFFPQENWVQFIHTFADQMVIAFENKKLIKQLKNAAVEITAAYDKTLEGWASALELRDHETKNHSVRVVDLSEKIAKKLGVPESELIHLRRGALLHDIGKIAIPDQILLKPGKLNAEEWQLMQAHPSRGFEMLEKIEYLQPALDIPLYHHEKWDGSGYPFGLKGEDIPLSARIFAVVDVWDALTSDRPYRKAWPPSDTFQHILQQSNRHFDAAVVRAFQEIYLAGELEL